MLDSDVLVRIRDFEVSFPVHRGVLRREVDRVRAVDSVSIDINRGEILGLVGESGCGKSTLGRGLLRLIEPTEGTVEFDGLEILGMSKPNFARMRHRMQMVFQDPVGSLNPRMKVERIVGEGTLTHGKVDRDAVKRAVVDVGLDPSAVDRYPHEFSGGQRQRIGLARALLMRPEFLVADEPVSALDVSIQAQVLNVMAEIRRTYALTYLFVAHDLAVVDYIADRVAVMYLGRVVEIGPSDQIRMQAQHPYTVALLSAVPKIDPKGARRRIVLQGDVPSPLAPPSGCRFRTRCPIARDMCAVVTPELAKVPEMPGHRVACHFPGELKGVS